MIRQAHPGPDVPAYHTFEEKIQDGHDYQHEDRIGWPVLVDDLAGTVHQVYGGLADPTYLVDAEGRVAFYNMWTYGPALHEAIEALLAQGGRGVVRGGIDHTPYLLPALTDGWRGLRRGLPQSYTDLMTASPGMASMLWLSYQVRPLLAPFTLRAEPLPAPVKLGLAVGAGLLLARWLGGAREQERHEHEYRGGYETEIGQAHSLQGR